MRGSSSTCFLALAAFVSSALAVPHVVRRQSTPPEGFTAAGFAPQDDVLTLRIALTQRDLPGLEKALYAAATPGGAQYGQYLTKDQVNTYASPPEEAIASVSSWLQSQGLTPSALSPSGDWISVKATVAQANRLLQAEYTRYQAEGFDEGVVRTLSFNLPDEVKDHIAAIHPTTVFPLLNYQHAPAIKNITSSAHSNVQGNSFSARQASPSNVPPACEPGSEDDIFAWTRPYGLTCRFALYEIPYTTVGEPVEGNNIWVSGYYNGFANKNRTKDYLREWRPDLIDREMFDLVTITGGMNSQLPIDASPFATGGVTSVMSATANTPVTFMSVGTENSDDAIVWFVDQANYLLTLEDPPKILVGDWPMPESWMDPAIASALCNSYAQLAARGVTLLFPVSSDGVGWMRDGSKCPKFDVTFPASCPYVTAIGASEISDDGTSEQIVPMNSGGFSNYFSRPAYQDATVPPYLEALEEGVYDGMYDPSGRGTPDISLHGWWTVSPTAGWAFGSQSFSTYLLGGILALLNEELISAGKPTLGFINPLLYTNVDAFHDFTSGNNAGCDTEGFNATVGWDPVSGVGSPSYARLRKVVGL